MRSHRPPQKIKFWIFLEYAFWATFQTCLATPRFFLSGCNLLARPSPSCWPSSSAPVFVITSSFRVLFRGGEVCFTVEGCAALLQVVLGSSWDGGKCGHIESGVGLYLFAFRGPLYVYIYIVSLVIYIYIYV